MKTIIFRTAGGPGIGFGHYFRTYSLARAISSVNQNIKILFVINSDLVNQLAFSEFEYYISESFGEDISYIEKYSPILFVLDSYLANDDYLLKVKRLTKLMIFDDNNDIYDSSIPDIILNGNIHAKELNYKSNQNTIYLLGPEYLVMREEYWETKVIEYERKHSVLITTGGTDPFGVSYELLSHLKQAPFSKKVVIGPGYTDHLINRLEAIRDEKIELIYKPKSLIEYIRSSRVTLTAGGSTVYEVISLGTIPIIFSIADNQDIACRYFANSGVLYFGKHPHIDYTNLYNQLCCLMSSNTESNNYKDNNLIDGRGVYRVLEKIDSYL